MQFEVSKLVNPSVNSRPWAVIEVYDDGGRYLQGCYRTKRHATEVRDAFAAAEAIVRKRSAIFRDILVAAVREGGGTK